MWIERQNTHIKVFMGIVLSFLIYQISIIAKFNKNALLQNLLITLISIIVLAVIINWLVDNDHNIVAWIIVLLPLVFIPTIVKVVCVACKFIN